jgi:hypothetical protein
MAKIKMTISELKAVIAQQLFKENIDFWDQEYLYDPRSDKVPDLVKAAMKWYGFEKSHLGIKDPADPKFLNKLEKRMNFLGIEKDIIQLVVFQLRKIAMLKKNI